jgi:hypothetical protein
MLSLAKFMKDFLEHQIPKGNVILSMAWMLLPSRSGRDPGRSRQHVKIIDPSAKTFVPRA